MNNKTYELLHSVEDRSGYGEVTTPQFLSDEMTSNISKDMYISSTSTFLFPCFGNGTDIITVIKILRSYGHSMENIESRVSGYEISVRLFNKVQKLLSHYNFSKLYNRDFLNTESDMKYDVVIGNPPYNAAGSATGNIIWDKFTIKSISLLKEGGYLAFIHPTLWRKPQSDSSKTKKVSDLMRSKQIHYLNMNSSTDGIKVFGAGTRFDYYVLENTLPYTTTTLVDEDSKKIELDITTLPFIPNSNIEEISKLLANEVEEKCPIVYDGNSYDLRKRWMSKEKTVEFKYPVVNTIPKTGVRLGHSSRNDKGLFGISKVIFSDNGFNDVIIDMEGEYATTQNSLSIAVESIQEAEGIKKALLSEEFKNLTKSITWSNFRVDWRLFTYFKKDFWREYSN